MGQQIIDVAGVNEVFRIGADGSYGNLPVRPRQRLGDE